MPFHTAELFSIYLKWFTANHLNAFMHDGGSLKGNCISAVCKDIPRQPNDTALLGDYRWQGTVARSRSNELHTTRHNWRSTLTMRYKTRYKLWKWGWKQHYSRLNGHGICRQAAREGEVKGVGVGVGEIMQHIIPYYTVGDSNSKGITCVHGVREERMYCSRLTVTHNHITAKKGCLHWYSVHSANHHTGNQTSCNKKTGVLSL